MKIVQRLLSHSLLIIVVVAASSAYVYRAELFPERFGTSASATGGNGMEEMVDAMRAKAESLKEQVVSAVGSSEPQVDATPATEPAAAAPELPPVVAGADVSSGDEVPAASNDVVNSDVAGRDVVTDDVVTSDAAKVAVAETPQFRPSAPDSAPEQDAPPTTLARVETPQPQPAADTTAAPQSSADNATGSGDTASKATEQLLRAAREAFWQRDFVTAEGHYKSLLEQQQDNPDVFGELGNLYFQLGRWPLAAEAYLQAGRRLVEQGEPLRAQHLLRVLRGLDMRKAAQLEMTMRDKIRAG